MRTTLSTKHWGYDGTHESMNVSRELWFIKKNQVETRATHKNEVSPFPAAWRRKWRRFFNGLRHFEVGISLSVDRILGHLPIWGFTIHYQPLGQKPVFYQCHFQSRKLPWSTIVKRVELLKVHHQLKEKPMTTLKVPSWLFENICENDPPNSLTSAEGHWKPMQTLVPSDNTSFKEGDRSESDQVQESHAWRFISHKPGHQRCNQIAQLFIDRNFICYAPSELKWIKVKLDRPLQTWFEALTFNNNLSCFKNRWGHFRIPDAYWSET